MKIKNPFSKPTVNDTANLELYEAQVRLLEAQSALEYASAMVTYHSNRVARLKAIIAPEVQQTPKYSKIEPVTK